MSGFHDPDTGRSMARYLGLSMREVADAPLGTTAIVGQAPADEHLRGPDGGIAFGALLTLADSAGGLGAGLAVLPGWVVSTNLMLRSVRRTVTGPIGIESAVVRAGRHAAVSTVTIVDRAADDATVAVGTLTSAVLEPADGPPVYERPLVLTFDPLDHVSPPPLPEFLGATPTGPDQLSVVITPEIRNPWGILHGGATAALVDLAGMHTTGGCATTDAVIHFVSPGRVGPITATVTDVGHRTDGQLLRIEVRDAGADDRLVATAVTTVAPT